MYIYIYIYISEAVFAEAWFMSGFDSVRFESCRRPRVISFLLLFFGSVVVYFVFACDCIVALGMFVVLFVAAMRILNTIVLRISAMTSIASITRLGRA